MKQHWCISGMVLGLVAAPVAAAKLLALEPSTCVLTSESSRCQIQLKISFVTTAAGLYCVETSQDQQSYCVALQPQQPKELQLPIDSQQDVQIRLRGPDQQLYAQASLKLAIYKPKRHKRGYLWNML